MKKKISFKKMLDIDSVKPKKLQKQRTSSSSVVTEKEIKKKTEQEDIIKQTTTDEEKDTKRKEYKKVVLFRLSNEYYGIDVSMIDEIIDAEIQNKIAGMPDFIKGVISVRGESVPVLSLFELFHIDDRPVKGTETILIISEDNETYGILIDELKGVIDVEPSSIFDIPAVYAEEQFSYLKCMIEYGTEIAAIVDTEQLMKKFK